MFIKSQKSMDSYYIVDSIYANGIHIFQNPFGDFPFRTICDLSHIPYFVSITMKYSTEEQMAKYSSREKAEKVVSMFLEWLDSTRVYEENFQFPEDEEVIVEEE